MSVNRITPSARAEHARMAGKSSENKAPDSHDRHSFKIILIFLVAGGPISSFRDCPTEPSRPVPTPESIATESNR
jgi:hypothetical protein